MSEGAFFLSLLAIEIIVGLIVITIPIIIAFWRRHPNRWIIAVVAVVFGATLLGWLIALVWSLHGFHRGREPTSRGGVSGLNLFEDDVRSVRIEPCRLLAEPSADMLPGHEPLQPTANVGARVERLSIAEAAAALDRLSQLHAQGHITEGELGSLKSQTISRM